MTLHKVKTCSCGHPSYDHPNRGPCKYGHPGTHFVGSAGGCDCPKFSTKRRKTPTFRLDEAHPTSPPPLATALAAAIKGLHMALDGLTGLRDVFLAEALDGAPTLQTLQGPSSITIDGHPYEDFEVSGTLIPPREPKAKPKPRPTDDSTDLRKGERRLLEVLARHFPRGLTREQLATLAGFSVSGGTFQTYLSTLRRQGLLLEGGGEITVSLDGESRAGAAMGTPMTRREVLDTWRSVLRAGERDMLNKVIAAGELSRETLALATGKTASGGTFQTYLSRLRRNGLVTTDGGVVRLGKALAEAR